MIKFRIKKPNLILPKINFQEDLRVIANRIIIPDMQAGIIAGKDIDDKSFTKNERKTVRRKGHNRVLQGVERKLLRSFKSKKRGKFSVLIFIASDRKEIARYLQVEGIRSNTRGLKKYKFFGVSKLAEKLAIDFMEQRIRKAVQSGW